ncbi:MAG: MFS transporter, partial [Caulobacteraceae bacterium]
MAEERATTVRTAGVTAATGGLAPGVVALLALAMFINYVDRGNFATAAPMIKDALRLSNTEVGILISAFFWVYAPGQFLAGWMADRWNVHRVLAGGLALWAVATALA